MGGSSNLPAKQTESSDAVGTGRKDRIAHLEDPLAVPEIDDAPGRILAS